MELIYANVVAEHGFDPLFVPEPEYCQALVFAGNRIDPPEYCEDEAVEGTEFCEKHARAGDEYEYEDGPPEGWDE